MSENLEVLAWRKYTDHNGISPGYTVVVIRTAQYLVLAVMAEINVITNFNDKALMSVSQLQGSEKERCIYSTLRH